jgi:anti-sigma B factor antagonist
VANANLETEIRRFDVCPILAVNGEIDVHTAPQFKQAVVGLITEGTRHVIIDLGGVGYMDSSGFSTLLSATKRLRPEGGAVHLVGARPVIQRMLHLTRLDTLLEVHPTLEEAVTATRHACNGHAS